MKRLLMLLVFLFAVPAMATLPLTATLEEMALGADHILVARVTGVDMVDADGKQVIDRTAMTGPGLTNTIRLKVSVNKVLVSNARPVPKQLMVPLDPLMHFSLGQIQDAHKGDRLVRLLLLKGRQFEPIKPGVFFRPIAEKDEVLRLHRTAKREGGE